ncbi:MAG: hypothetical protein AAF769_00010 [Pseudomonadota bacterium]
MAWLRQERRNDNGGPDRRCGGELAKLGRLNRLGVLRVVIVVPLVALVFAK